MSINKVAEDILMHYGVKRRSGRYPWGSGDNPFQHSGDWLSAVNDLKKSGMTETAIADYFEMSTGELRTWKAVAKDEQRILQIKTIKSMTEDGYGATEIGRKLGIGESQVRSLMKEGKEKKINTAREVANHIKKEVDSRGYIDVGKGVELEFSDPNTGHHISREKLEQALTILNAEGYPIYGLGVSQVSNPNQQTTVEVICPKGATYGDAYKHASDIQSLKPYNVDVKDIPKEQLFHYPESISSKRIQVRYAEEGGAKKDGVIELRRGVEDISLGAQNYAQVRILVDGTHYLKGMAMYNDNMPEGVDIIFNTNKKIGTPMTGDPSAKTVLKPIERNSDGTPADNPFGAAIKQTGGQRWYSDANGNEKLSAINKVNQEGDWNEWSRTLSSQFLSKQPRELVKRQLDLSYSQHEADFERIKSLNNPTVKRALLNEFANNCDSAAVDLKAASLPRQASKVILPITSLKDNEIYAPGYRQGEEVVLIRYPHAGIFEIPTLRVNNKHPEAKSLLGNSIDAVGINSNVAERLSGADFDGDSVVVIPINDKVKVNTSKPLTDLVGFDPKEAYPYREGMKVMNKTTRGIEMGKVSNLITDMTLQGAPSEEVARAVKHSMVVIDAYKHKLDYRQSYIDNNIAELKEKWQKHYTEDGKVSYSAATIISRASGEKDVLKRKGNPNVNPYTGEQSWDEMTYFDPKKGKEVTKPSKYVEEKFNQTLYWNEDTKKWQGKKIDGAKTKTVEKIRTTKSTQMAETKDARTLISPSRHIVEIAYADYANKMKQMANAARKEAYSTGRLKYSTEAAKTYSEEVETLKSKLYLAELNAPRERQAQIFANAIFKARKQDNPGMSKDQAKKIKTQSLQEARLKVGASGKNTRIVISHKEWEAIQAGAISDTTLTKILAKSDMTEIKKLATPRENIGMTTSQIALMKSMNKQGYTIAEIADRLGVSSSTISKNIKK